MTPPPCSGVVLGVPPPVVAILLSHVMIAAIFFAIIPAKLVFVDHPVVIVSGRSLIVDVSVATIIFNVSP